MNDMMVESCGEMKGHVTEEPQDSNIAQSNGKGEEMQSEEEDDDEEEMEEEAESEEVSYF